MYGYEPGRARAATFPDLRPPFKTLWEHDTSLIEFPPVAANGKVFVAEARGHFYATDGATGDIVWEQQFKRCSAGSPAYADGVVYHAYMGPRCRRVPGAKGLVVAMDSETGKIKWRANTEVIESSLLYVKGSLYFGGWDGKIVSLDAKTGKQQWSFGADSGVTSSVAYPTARSSSAPTAARSTRSTRRAASCAGRAVVLDFRKREYFYATPAVALRPRLHAEHRRLVYSFGEKTEAPLGPHAWHLRLQRAARSGRRRFSSARTTASSSLDAATGDVKWKYSAPRRCTARRRSSTASSTLHAQGQALRLGAARSRTGRAARSGWTPSAGR